jgi:Phospholipase_D-nuclease N-terminal
MTRVLVPLLGLALAIYALVDCVQTPEKRIQYLPKMAWAAVIVLAPLIGPAAWIATGKVRDLPAGGPGRRPRGPDDDPDFLRGL